MVLAVESFWTTTGLLTFLLSPVQKKELKLPFARCCVLLIFHIVSILTSELGHYRSDAGATP